MIAYGHRVGEWWGWHPRESSEGNPGPPGDKSVFVKLTQTGGREAGLGLCLWLSNPGIKSGAVNSAV